MLIPLLVQLLQPYYLALFNSGSNSRGFEEGGKNPGTIFILLLPWPMHKFGANIKNHYIQG